MYVDIVISNVYNLNTHFFFFLFFSYYNYYTTTNTLLSLTHHCHRIAVTYASLSPYHRWHLRITVTVSSMSLAHHCHRIIAVTYALLSLYHHCHIHINISLLLEKTVIITTEVLRCKDGVLYRYRSASL